MSTEALTNEVGGYLMTEENYVPQTTSRSCGIAGVLMARNLLSGKTYPESVEDALDLMETRGYKRKKLGRTDQRDRTLLTRQLSEQQETRLIHKHLSMPEGKDDYLEELVVILDEGGVILVGFTLPYFELPDGVEIVKRDGGVSHMGLIHGYRREENKVHFIVTDPDPNIKDLVGMNIDVPQETLYDCVADKSKKDVGIIFTTV